MGHKHDWTISKTIGGDEIIRRCKKCGRISELGKSAPIKNGCFGNPKRIKQ